MADDDYIADVQVLNLSDVPEDSTDGTIGFIRCVSGTINGPRTSYQVQANTPGQIPPGKTFVFDEDFEVPAGEYQLIFEATGANRPPRSATVNVRAGVGAIVVVYYYKRSELEEAAAEAEEDLREIKRLLAL